MPALDSQKYNIRLRKHIQNSGLCRLVVFFVARLLLSTAALVDGTFVAANAGYVTPFISAASSCRFGALKKLSNLKGDRTLATVCWCHGTYT